MSHEFTLFAFCTYFDIDRVYRQPIPAQLPSPSRIHAVSPSDERRTLSVAALWHHGVNDRYLATAATIPQCQNQWLRRSTSLAAAQRYCMQATAKTQVQHSGIHKGGAAASASRPPYSKHNGAATITWVSAVAVCVVFLTKNQRKLCVEAER